MPKYTVKYKTLFREGEEHIFTFQYAGVELNPIPAIAEALLVISRNAPGVYAVENELGQTVIKIHNTPETPTETVLNNV